MLFYLAGSTIYKEFLTVIKSLLIYEGHEVSSSWLHSAEQYSSPKCTEEHMRKGNPRNLEEIKACDVFLLDRTGRRWGKVCEQGAALALAKPIWLVGPHDSCGPAGKVYHNVFDSLADRRFKNWCELFAVLETSADPVFP